MQKASQNLLGEETSAYLLQHRHNPVHWRPWGEPALRRARERDLPILLSIGYSACHWCHVMAHESFEDEATARAMNELFVNIKVDREERPDLDKIYQLTHQLLAHRPGGWPLTVFLDPRDLLPFFSGTYFPRETRLGLPSFPEVLRQVGAFYREERHGRLPEITASLEAALRRLRDTGPPRAAPVDLLPLRRAREELAAEFDARHGGFGAAPKFPPCPCIEFLLCEYTRGRDGTGRGAPGALEMALTTLRGMARGGVCDQVGGGFFRYSVDEAWEIPHFEKMLYDNALLLPLYAQAWTLRPEPLLRDTALQAAQWMIRVLQAPEGGFRSSLDADSEGGEGAYYSWEAQAAQELLEPGEWQLLGPRFGLDGPPNFEGRHHLLVRRPPAEAEPEPEPEAETTLRCGLERLLQAREQRPPPGLDDKIPCSWNALAIKGLARTARLLEHPELLQAAERCLAFLRDRLWPDGILHAQHCKGLTRYPAYLDDCAFLLEALLEMLECRWSTPDLEDARRLAEQLLEDFEDRERGGFYFTPHRHEQLPDRPRSFHDESLPAGSGVAARALQRLGGLLGETRYLEAAQRCLRAAVPVLERNPRACCTLLATLEESQVGVQRVVIRGRPEQLPEWRAACGRRFVPGRMVLVIPEQAGELPAGLGECAPRGAPTAYLCRGTACQAVISDPRELAEALASDPLEGA